MATQLIPLPEVERLSASVLRILGGNPGKVGIQTHYRAQKLTPRYSSHYKVIQLSDIPCQKHLTKSKGTNTYLVGRGQNRILIDTGEGKPTWATRLESILSQEKATVHQALITHWHGDHVNGIPDLLRICPKATIYKHDPGEGQMGIEDGQVFATDGATLRAFHTPGHTMDHMAFVLEEEDAIFTGDSKSQPSIYSVYPGSNLML